MQFDCRKCARAVLACALATMFAVPPTVLAQTAASHVVSPAELQRAAMAASQARQRNVEQVRQFLSSEQAQNAMRSAHMDPAKVKTAVASLSDAELAQLAARSQKAQTDFAAGTIDNRDLLLLILGVAALILIIVAVR
jgi:hypothetical protein